MRSFEFALKDGEKMYENAQLPEYQTKLAAGADFFCAEEVTIPSIWGTLLCYTVPYCCPDEKPLEIKRNIARQYSMEENKESLMRAIEDFSPTLVHTGIKANMEDDEVLYLYNRSSNPKRGLVLANSVGVIDADYYGNKSNDGEIMFAFYNFMPFDVTIKVGDRIGQGIFQKFLRPEVGLKIKEVDRTGGHGSTDK